MNLGLLTPPALVPQPRNASPNLGVWAGDHQAQAQSLLHGPCLTGSVVKNTPAKQRSTQVQPLGREDPLGKEKATHSSILAWKIPETAETGRLQSMGSQGVRHHLVTEQQQQPYFMLGVSSGLNLKGVCGGLEDTSPPQGDGKRPPCTEKDVEHVVGLQGKAGVEKELPKKTSKSCQSLVHTEISVLAALRQLLLCQGPSQAPPITHWRLDTHIKIHTVCSFKKGCHNG